MLAEAKMGLANILEKYIIFHQKGDKITRLDVSYSPFSLCFHNNISMHFLYFHVLAYFKKLFHL